MFPDLDERFIEGREERGGVLFVRTAVQQPDYRVGRALAKLARAHPAGLQLLLKLIDAFAVGLRLLLELSDDFLELSQLHVGPLLPHRTPHLHPPQAPLVCRLEIQRDELAETGECDGPHHRLVQELNQHIHDLRISGLDQGSAGQFASVNGSGPLPEDAEHERRHAFPPKGAERARSRLTHLLVAVGEQIREIREEFHGFRPSGFNPFDEGQALPGIGAMLQGFPDKFVGTFLGVSDRRLDCCRLRRLLACGRGLARLRTGTTAHQKKNQGKVDPKPSHRPPRTRPKFLRTKDLFLTPLLYSQAPPWSTKNSSKRRKRRVR